ncbi:MAG: hypothetical protein ACYSRQ_00460, partial [Planctomycetota bacterium]
MKQLIIPRPTSAGILLSYKCSCACRHCMYNCSAKWQPDYISESDLKTYASQLASTIESSGFGP